MKICKFRFVFLITTVLLVPSSVLCTDQTTNEQILNADSSDQRYEYTYQPMGRRDPFKPLVDKKEPVVETIIRRPDSVKGPLERYEINQFRLLAIMVIGDSPSAMVKAPDGKSFTVKLNDYIGMNDGKIIKIQPKVTEIDNTGMSVEKSPDRIVIEETVHDNLTGKEVRQERYIIM